MTWTIAARYATVGEAEAARSALYAAEIETFIADENMVAVDWLASNAVGGVKVMVREEDREQAEHILGELAAAIEIENTPLTTSVAEPLTCSECRSGSIERVPRLRIFVLIAALCFGFGYAFGQSELVAALLLATALILAFVPTHRCVECGHRWSPPRAQESLLPDPHDLAERACPRCGSTELHRISYRKLKAVPLLFNFAILLILPIYLALPKWECENCRFRA